MGAGIALRGDFEAADLRRLAKASKDDLAHRVERVLDDAGAGERAPEFVRQAETDDGEDLVQPLQDAAVRPCPRRPGPRPDGAQTVP